MAKLDQLKNYLESMSLNVLEQQINEDNETVTLVLVRNELIGTEPIEPAIVQQPLKMIFCVHYVTQMSKNHPTIMGGEEIYCTNPLNPVQWIQDRKMQFLQKGTEFLHQYLIDTHLSVGVLEKNLSTEDFSMTIQLATIPDYAKQFNPFGRREGAIHYLNIPVLNQPLKLIDGTVLHVINVHMSLLPAAHRREFVVQNLKEVTDVEPSPDGWNEVVRKPFYPPVLPVVRGRTNFRRSLSARTRGSDRRQTNPQLRPEKSSTKSQSRIPKNERDPFPVLEASKSNPQGSDSALKHIKTPYSLAINITPEDNRRTYRKLHPQD